MALVTTMPTRSRKPINAGRLNDRSVITSAISAPTTASGILSTTMNGIFNEPSVATITRYTRETPMAIAT